MAAEVADNCTVGPIVADPSENNCIKKQEEYWSLLQKNQVLFNFLYFVLDPKKAVQDNSHLLNGLTVHQGNITHKGVAKGLNMDYAPFN